MVFVALLRTIDNVVPATIAILHYLTMSFTFIALRVVWVFAVAIVNGVSVVVAVIAGGRHDDEDTWA